MNGLVAVHCMCESKLDDNSCITQTCCLQPRLNTIAFPRMTNMDMYIWWHKIFSMYLYKYSLNKHRAFEATCTVTHDHLWYSSQFCLPCYMISYIIWLIWDYVIIMWSSMRKQALCTQNTPLHIIAVISLSLQPSYMSFVNCIKSPIVYYISCKSTSIVDKLCKLH